METTDEKTTEVQFLFNGRTEDLFAYFPELDYNISGTSKVCYSHIGQHSGVGPEYVKECRVATPEEYKDLFQELENLGYKLQIKNL